MYKIHKCEIISSNMAAAQNSLNNGPGAEGTLLNIVEPC